MKYKGGPIERIAKMIRIPQAEIELEIRTYPVGVSRRFEAFYPEPKPPIKNTVDAKTGKVEEKSNWNDANFNKALRDHNHYRTYYMLWLGVKDSANLEFETKNVDSIDSLKAFEKEILDSGLSEGDIGYVLNQISELSNLTLKEITDAKEVF